MSLLGNYILQKLFYTAENCKDSIWLRNESINLIMPHTYRIIHSKFWFPYFAPGSLNWILISCYKNCDSLSSYDRQY